MTRKIKKTKDKDKGAKKILRELKSLRGSSIDAGYFTNVASGDPSVTIAEVATFNEFGTSRGAIAGLDFVGPILSDKVSIGIPPRPFMRPAFDKNIVKYTKVTKELLLKIAGKKLGGLRVLKTIGALMVSDIKQEITNVRTPPNAPATIEAKGFDNPLIETGTMKNRTDFRIKL